MSYYCDTPYVIHTMQCRPHNSDWLANAGRGGDGKKGRLKGALWALLGGGAHATASAGRLTPRGSKRQSPAGKKAAQRRAFAVSHPRLFLFFALRKRRAKQANPEAPPVGEKGKQRRNQELDRFGLTAKRKVPLHIFRLSLTVASWFLSRALLSYVYRLPD